MKKWAIVLCELLLASGLAALPQEGRGPDGQPGEDPYTVHEFRDEVDARTLQDGSIATPPTEPPAAPPRSTRTEDPPPETPAGSRRRD